MHVFSFFSLLGVVPAETGVHECGTKKAPLSLQSPQSKHLHLTSSREIQGTPSILVDKFFVITYLFSSVFAVASCFLGSLRKR